MNKQAYLINLCILFVIAFGYFITNKHTQIVKLERQEKIDAVIRYSDSMFESAKNRNKETPGWMIKLESSDH